MTKSTGSSSTVGIAYGSDVKQAMKLMIEAADENENVLTEPKPVATFEAFRR